MTTNRDRDLDPALDLNRSLGPSSPFASPHLAFPLLVDRFYASLICHAPSAEIGLGGRLLYVGELDENGRALMVAANIAGAASLAATADSAARKQSIYDGAADFLVTDLDEALRILKNQVRKRESVAVCVAASPQSIEQEMLERGVLPDLVRDPGAVGAAVPPCDFGGSPIPIAPAAPAQRESILAWSLDESPAKWLPRLDAIAIECLASDESPSAQIARRWLRFAPRYVGRLASNVRVLSCPELIAHDIANRMRASVQSGEIPVPVRIEFVLP
jgi:hypothetical protein